MTTFDKREEGFEKQFALDEELRFKATARRNKLIGLWAAEKLGLSGADAENYAKSVVMADFEEQGDHDVVGKIRRDFQSRLDGILVEGFAHDPERSSRGQPLLFGGCYFAGTGGTEATQAFVQSVFERLLEEQEELEWSPAIVREDVWFRRIAYAGFALDAALLALVVLLFRNAS